MIKRICTICARGGSKGLKNKNIILLAGKPLIAHSIEQAKKSNLFDAVAVSSDAESILSTAKEWGADFSIRRPDELATDTASKLPAIRHAILETEKQLGYKSDVAVEVDATSPLRLVTDIKNCVEMLESKKVSNVITAAPSRHSPYFNMVELTKEGYARLSKAPERPVLRRQDVPQCYDMNASIYVWRRDIFIQSPAVFYPDTLLYEMPRERSVDIDSEFDFEVVKLLMSRQMQEG